MYRVESNDYGDTLHKSGLGYHGGNDLKEPITGYKDVNTFWRYMPIGHMVTYPSNHKWK